MSSFRFNGGVHEGLPFYLRQPERGTGEAHVQFLDSFRMGFHNAFYVPSEYFCRRGRLL